MLDRVVTMAFGAGIGFAVAGLLTTFRVRNPPEALIRTNVSGARVPAVLGGPLAIGALLGLLCLLLIAGMGWEPAAVGAPGAAVALVVVVLFFAGVWDDFRGDEQQRGFRGHVQALRRGRVTGGAVKLLGGAIAGLAAGALLSGGRGIVEVALVVALSANLVNLLDRAPGRAVKASLLAGIPLLFVGPEAWAVAAASVLGAVAACVVPDLRERAMLGDAGANPIGGVIGVGLAASLSSGGRLAAIAVLVVANLASERWSFSAVIERTPVLRALDRWGRRRAA